MTMISAIVAPAVTLSATACARYPMNVPSIMMFLVIVFAFGLGFDFHDRSAEEIRNFNNTKG